jgi:hypothetical protein
MKRLISNQNLRAALDLKLDAIDHRKKIRELGQQYHHTIEFEAFNSEETCVPYALQLTDDPTYEAVRRAFGHIFAGAEFMGWLLSGRLSELSAPQTGCLVCYFSDVTWKHIGVVTAEDRIVSKWGEMPRYRHSLAEVPAAYGENVKFFQRPSLSTARALFRDFALSQGLREEEIERALNKWARGD